MATAPTYLLFLCTGNSCRSQMAEGYARALGGNTVAVRSAGIEAHGKNPLAVAVMAGDGIDISGQESTRLTPELIQWADVVITLCGHADEQCPALPAGTRKEHWPLADPAGATGTEEEIRGVFRRTRDEVRGRVETLLRELRSIEG